ncbi:MAG: tripartite motif-containing protein 71 [Myxococcota bacterium]|jgi:tripartite motif-containing protein 71
MSPSILLLISCWPDIPAEPAETVATPIAPKAAPPPVVLPDSFESLSYEAVDGFGRPAPADPSRFNLPSGIAVDSGTGDFYVADTLHRRIQRFKADGTFITEWKTLAAMGITVDPTDHSVLLTLPGKLKVIRYSPDGEELGEIVGSDSGKNELDEPVDVAVHPKDGRVYVLDKGGYVVVFGRLGKPLARWLSGYQDPANDDRGMLRRGHRSMGIDLSPDGKHVYISNSGSCMVSQFTSEGEIVRRWGEERSSEPGLFRWNRGMAIDGDGRVIVADTDNERLQIFSATGEFERWFRGPHDEESGIFHPRSVAVNQKTGQIYATASYSHRVDIFTSTGDLVRSIGGLNTEGDILNEARNFTVEPTTGKFYVSARRDHVIKRFDTDGTHELSFIPGPGPIDGVDAAWVYQANFQFPAPLQFAPDGTLWAIRQGYHYADDPTPAHLLRQYDREGRFLSAIEHEALAGYMMGFDIHDQTGEFFITSTRDDRIVHMSATGELVRTFGDTGETPLKDPTGLAIDESRKLMYVTDSGNDRVVVYDLEGNQLSEWGSTGKKLGEYRLLPPSGVAVDDCGLVYVADRNNRRVVVHTPEGEPITYMQLNGQPKAKPLDVVAHGDRISVVGDGEIKHFIRSGLSCEG